MAPVKKKVVKKAPVKKRTTRTKKEPEFRTELCFIKLSTGDELVGHVDDQMFSDTGLIVVIKPMRLSTYADQILLTAWALSAETQQIITLPIAHIVALYPVDEQMKILHTVAAENYDFSKTYYDQMIYNTVQAYQRNQERRKNLPEPTESEIQNLETQMKEIFKEKEYTTSASVPDGVRTREELVNSLVELAEKHGKGKNAGS